MADNKALIAAIDKINVNDDTKADIYEAVTNSPNVAAAVRALSSFNISGDDKGAIYKAQYGYQNTAPDSQGGWGDKLLNKLKSSAGTPRADVQNTTLDTALGALKGAGETGYSLASNMRRRNLANMQASGVPSIAIGQRQNLPDAGNMFDAQNTAQSIGKGGERIAEALATAPAVGGFAKPLAMALPAGKVATVAANTIPQAGVAGWLAALHGSQNPGTEGMIAAATPLAFRGAAGMLNNQAGQGLLRDINSLSPSVAKIIGQRILSNAAGAGKALRGSGYAAGRAAAGLYDYVFDSKTGKIVPANKEQE